MAEVQSEMELFDRMGVKVVAASTDAEPDARTMAAELQLSFPVSYGVASSQIDIIGAVHGERRGLTIVQPAEFVINPHGKVMASMYATTQLGRMNPGEILQFLKSRI